MSQIKKALDKAEEHKDRYNWLGAADFYGQALGMLAETDNLRKAEISEKMGLCLYMTALQAKSQSVFNKRIRMAIKAYESASCAFSSLDGATNQASSIRCKAKGLLCAQRLLREHGKIRKGLNTILESQRKALEIYRNCGDQVGAITQSLDVMQTLNDLLEYEERKEKRTELIVFGLACGEEAVRACLASKNKRDLVNVYLKFSELCGAGSGVLADENRRAECGSKQRKFLVKALELSEEMGDLLARTEAVCSYVHWQKLRSAGEAAPVYLRNMQDLLEECRKTRIAEAIVTLINSIMYGLCHQLVAATDRDSADEIFSAMKRYLNECIKLSRVNRGKIRAIASLGDAFWSFGIGCRYYALLFEENPVVRKMLLNKGIETAKKIPSCTTPIGRMYFLSTYSYHLNNRASIERNAAKRKELLLRALRVSNEWTDSIENLFPHFHQLIADHLLVYSSIRAKLAQLEASDKQAKMLRDASEYSKKGIKYLAAGSMDKSLRINMANALVELGRIQFQLYRLSGDRSSLEEAYSTLNEATKTYSAEGLHVRTAETLWGLANMQDASDQFQEAAENFQLASGNFKRVASENSQLKGFYTDYSSYMDAWSEIELAKQTHQREDYDASTKHYARAAAILQLTGSWHSQSPGFLAFSQLEYAEDLSRKERSQEAIQAFKAASDLFGEARKALETRIWRTQSSDEKRRTDELIVASSLKKQYCRSRIDLEEARLCAKEGNYELSAKKYGDAVAALEQMEKATERESDRQELLSMIYSCKAWQKMTLAEETNEPKLYAEASKLFWKSKESSLKTRPGLLAAGNCYICRALEFGAKFKATRNLEFYYKAKQYMESASNYYTEAGFERESTWVSATQVLFDAFVYVQRAENEIDPGKKTKLYQMAERCLQASAQLFTESGYFGKRAEALKHLDKVKRKWEFAVSLTEVLKAPLPVFSTASLSAPVLTHEDAGGLDRFEHASIQTNLTLEEPIVKVGEWISLGMELVNVGRGTASLMKVEGLIPGNTEASVTPDTYKVEDHTVNMKGKRLGSLETEKISLVLKSSTEGTYSLKPRVTYLDETGEYKSYELEPVTIEVLEALPDRISTGFRDLDNLLLGGLPKDNATLFTSRSCDEKDMLIEKFLEVGIKDCQIFFYITARIATAKKFLGDLEPNSFVLICSPQAEAIAKGVPNVRKMKGIDNLTDISIALDSAFRSVPEPQKIPRRACVDIVSDVLLQHHALHTRRWLNSVISEFKINGFTVLATIDPGMHTPQEIRAIQDLFEGEICLFEKETGKGVEKFLRINKMLNARYSKNELRIQEERLRQRS